MYSFSRSSLSRLTTCHPDIRAIMYELIKVYDCSVIEGIRTTGQQQKYFSEGKSKLDGINKLSKHQDDGSGLSRAIDILPYKKGTNAFSGKESDNRRFYFMMGLVRGIATRLLSEGVITHRVRFGLDWDSDDTFEDQSFDDLPHWEII